MKIIKFADALRGLDCIKTQTSHIMQQHIDSYDFTGKRAIVRVDFNVPLNENFEITDDTRIRRAMPTL